MSGTELTPIYPLPGEDVVLEAVHFTSSIQPHGVLLTLSNPDLLVLQVSANLSTYLGGLLESWLHQPLSQMFPNPAIALIQAEVTRLNRLPADRDRRSPIYLHLGEQSFQGTLYGGAEVILLELEPATPSPVALTLHWRSSLKTAIAQLRQVPDRTKFLQLATEEIRRLTGFDRVLVYQFDAQGAGAVMAESKRDDLPTYLGLHYPATDIPAAVRSLYQRGMVRYIPDIQAPPVALVPVLNPLTQQPPDLSRTALRGVDACCVNYHCNMDVAAIFVMALTQGDTLWGLISCHHQTPKVVDYEVRESCELLAQVIASELANKVNIEELAYLTKLRSLQSEFVQSIAQTHDLKQALIHPLPRLLELVGAQGAAVCLEQEITLVGTTPSQEQVQALLRWLEAPRSSAVETDDDRPRSPLFQTDSLPRLYAAALAFKDSASGLLALQISQVHRYTILWFRPEVLQTINWAGDPSSSRTVAADGSAILCPRKSFEQWQQIVQCTALPWKASELESALDLRGAIVGIVLKKADELARVNQELEGTIRELDAFAYAASHDLKEPLRGIHNFSSLLLKGYADRLDDTGRSRLHTLMRLTRRMESLIDALLKFSRLGQADLNRQPTDLNQSLHQALNDLRVSRPEILAEIRIPRPLPVVNCDAVLIREVLTNLLSNAVKYTDKPKPWIEIGYLTGEEMGTEQSALPSSPLMSYTLYVCDNGIGIRERHLSSIFRLFKRLHEQHLYGGGTGAGLTIAKKIIERHGGQLWVESTYGEGSTFYFTLAPTPPSQSNVLTRDRHGSQNYD